MILILSIIMFSTSFFRAGCLFYPIHSTCFSSQKIIWSQKKFINDYSKVVELWAKGFYHQKGTKYDPMPDPQEFNKNFNWMKFWIEKHFFYKIFEFIIIVLVAYLISYIYFTKEKSKKKFQKNNFILLIIGIVSLYLWINFLPQFRFGFSLIIIFIFLLLRCISETDIIYDKRKVIKLFLICFIFLNFKNINRINSEFKRDDFYKFTNFPFFNEPKLVFKYDDYKIEKLFHTQIINKLK